jgi:7-cyano-7-deazaguanine synthase in queuosine biosynthesis
MIAHPDHGALAKKKFPFSEDLIFGKNAKPTETMKKAYPECFKNYFFKIVNSIVNMGRGKGSKFVKTNLIMLVGARVATLVDDVENKTKNRKLAAGVFKALSDK